MTRWLWMLVFCFSSHVLADLQGTIRTTDGQRYDVSSFGFPANPKDYYLKTDQGFIPLAQVRQVSRAGTGLIGEPAFYVITTDGKILRAKIGLLFFNRVVYSEPVSGAELIGYEAVIKGRGSDGLLFTSQATDSEYAQLYEIHNPSDVEEMVLWAARL